MRALLCFDRQESRQIAEFEQEIKQSNIDFDGIDIIDSDSLIDWLIEYKEDKGTLVVTDILYDGENWQQLINTLTSGFILHISERDYEGTIKPSCMIKRAADINRALHYFQASVKSEQSQLLQYISADSVKKEEAILEIIDKNRMDIENRHDQINIVKKTAVMETAPTIDEIYNGKKNRYVVPIKNEIQSAPAKKEQLDEVIDDVENKNDEVGSNIIDLPHTSKAVEASNEMSQKDYQARKRNIQRQLFARQKWNENKTIAIWSPIHRVGVTTFTMNFAYFLAENRVYTAVLEGLSDQPVLKDWLKRYTSVPTSWKSYATTIQSNEEDPLSAEWNYRNVMFLPLDTSDQFSWDEESLESYITTINIVDITLVDLPTGKMAKYTEDSLKYVDQICIMVDDTFQEIIAWKDYIHEIKERTGKPIYLIFNKEYDFSQTKRMEKELGLQIIAKLPPLNEAVMRNYYDTDPIYAEEETHQLLQEGYETIAQHIFQNKFERKTDNVFHQEKWLSKILKPLKRNRMFDKLNG
ncbi:GTPase domain-containing protein [Viridibacillus arvi]|uniref:GTPase domain-containing protein n=1 Tax=Viridibacillus arvi TaxID=263475 RepID=UPI003D2E2F04